MSIVIKPQNVVPTKLHDFTVAEQTFHFTEVLLRVSTIIKLCRTPTYSHRVSASQTYVQNNVLA